MQVTIGETSSVLPTRMMQAKCYLYHPTRREKNDENGKIVYPIVFWAAQ